MKKQRQTPIDAPTVLKDSFKSSDELPSVEAVNTSIKNLTSHSEATAVTDAVSRKKETGKGTVLQNLMIEKIILKQLKQYALDRDESLSFVANRAFELYLYEKNRNK